MKPDWKDAPDWANYLAMDGSGFWYWYEFKPTRVRIGGAAGYWGEIEGRCQIDDRIKWEDSLEKRPE